MSYFLNGTGRLCASARNPPEMGAAALDAFGRSRGGGGPNWWQNSRRTPDFKQLR
jgi:hypothetical protein